MDTEDLAIINAQLDHDIELKEKIKDQVTEFDKKARTMVGTLNKVHSTPANTITKLLDSVRPTLASCADVTAAIANLVPPNQFWRYKDMWHNPLRSVIFCAALMEYLTCGSLLSLPQTSHVLGIKDEWNDRFYLQAEDYLHGLITLVNELSRLAVNAVTLGDYDQPFRISIFVKNLFAGFSMLNLKNDTLRRRFDSLKYDIKKIEEVVYDVSLRQLAPSVYDSVGQEKSCA